MKKQKIIKWLFKFIPYTIFCAYLSLMSVMISDSGTINANNASLFAFIGFVISPIIALIGFIISFKYFNNGDTKKEKLSTRLPLLFPLLVFVLMMLLTS